MKIYLLKRKGKLSDESVKNGRKPKTSLYLVYYFGSDRKREYEFLNLFLYDKPKSTLERDHNKETLKLAEAIKAKKILDAQNTQHGFVSNVKGKTSFFKFFKSLVDKRFDSLGNYGNWKSVYKHLQIFCKGEDISLDKVDEHFLEGFKEYLLNIANSRDNKEVRLARNTALSYFNKVRTTLREAYNQRLIKENPAVRVKCIKAEDTKRQFLTVQELQKLAVTECELPVLKTAFLFSALTGLRWSDVSALCWKNISHIESEGWFINFTQKKTKGLEVLPVSEQAIKLLGGRKADDEKIFQGLKYSAWNNKALKRWIKSAGINKDISYHSSRHTYSVTLLTMNVDIYTVSKLLGHRHLKTTEIYSHIVDKKKIEAANKIPDIFPFSKN